MEIKCSCCGRSVDILSVSVDEDGNAVCDSCAYNHYIRCEKCGKLIKKSECRMICTECDEGVYKRSINTYGTKPIPRFKGKYNNNNAGRFYGFELEYSYLPSQSAFILFSNLYKDKWIYNKSDSSLSDGVEIVTNPLSKQKAKELFNLMEEGLSSISQIKDYSKDAGVHIHVNRKSLDPITVYKLSYLLNYMAPSIDRRIIYYISGRNKSSTSLSDDYHYAQIGNIERKTSLKKPDSRYSALNLSNKNTIEFRIFKSTADKDMLIMYMDFVDDMIRYCHSNGLIDINIPSFISWELKNASNKLIVNKIKQFQRKNGVFTPRKNLTKLSINLLKGIRIDKYSDLISSLKRSGNIEEAYKIIQDTKAGLPIRIGTTPPKCKGRYELISRMENTLKKVYISKILKEQSKCV